MADDSEEAAAWRAFLARRDVESRNRLIEHHLPLARTIAATTYARRGGLQVEFADYLQFATLGLIEAVDRYRPDQGATFPSFASLRIRGAILNSLEGLSEHYQQVGLQKRLREERLDSLRQGHDTGRRRDLFDVLADMAVGLALARLLEGSGMLQAPEEPEPAYRQEFYATAEERQLRETLARLVQALPEQERRVIRYHYFQNVSFGDIAVLLGVSKGRVSQIHRQALLLLREARSGRTLDLGL